MVSTLRAQVGRNEFHATNYLDEIMRSSPTMMVQALRKLKYITRLNSMRPGMYVLTNKMFDEKLDTVYTTLNNYKRSQAEQASKRRAERKEKKATDPLMLIHSELKRIGDLLFILVSAENLRRRRPLMQIDPRQLMRKD